MADFLGRAIDRPSDLAVASAMRLLVSIGAITAKEQLTDLGRHLSRLPLDPRLGKMLFVSCFLGCLDPMLTVAAAASNRSPFNIPSAATVGSRAKGQDMLLKAKQRIARGSSSDHIALVELFRRWKSFSGRGAERRRFLADHFASEGSLRQIDRTRRDLLRQLQEMGFARGNYCEANSDSTAVLLTVITAGLYPNVAVVKPGRKTLSCRDAKTVKIHISSLNHRVQIAEGANPQHWFVFQEALKGANLNIQLQMTSPTNPYALLLVCFDHAAEADALAETAAQADSEEGRLERKLVDEVGEPPEDEDAHAFDITRVNEWISFHVPRQFAAHMRALRSRLYTALEGFLHNPRARLPPSVVQARSTAVRILVQEAGFDDPKAARRPSGQGFDGGSGRPGSLPGGNVAKGRPGDWTCPHCQANVYASKQACFKCGTPKPVHGTVQIIQRDRSQQHRTGGHRDERGADEGTRAGGSGSGGHGNNQHRNRSRGGRGRGRGRGRSRGRGGSSRGRGRGHSSKGRGRGN